MSLFKIAAFFIRPCLRRLDPYVRQAYEIMTSRTLRRTAMQSLVGMVMMALLVGVSLCAYLGFYWIYIPPHGHVAKIHFQHYAYHQQQQQQQPLNHPIGYIDSTGSVASKQMVVMTGPSAIVDLSRGGKQRQILRGEQAYDISVWLTVPTSSTNVGLGNFMIKVQLQNRNGQALITSSRPAIVTFESFLLRISRTVWRAIPLLLKWTREAQTLRVSLMENFVEDTSNPVSQVIIEISNPHLQIYKASLHINARFQGLRYFMYYYRISTAVVFISIFIFWELVFCVLTWQFLTSWFELEPSTVADTATASSLIATQGNRFDTHHWSRDRIMDRGTPSQILQRQHHSHTLDRPWIQTFLPWTRTETQHRPPQQQLQDGRSRLLASSSLLTADSDDNDDFDDDDDDHDDHVEEDSDDTGKGAVLAALTASEHHAALSSARLRRTTRVSSDTDRT